MPEKTHCSHCKAELSAEISPEGLCPDCLMGLALEDWSTGGDKGDSDADEQLTRTADAAALTPDAPTHRFDSYRLIQKLGEGGMGEVWLAEQQKPVRRKVAIKLIKRGMDTKNVVARFESERQALAMMDHANVARVFDAGSTPEGRPYFAMEYVKGIPITEHCDRHRLDTGERLELFMQVCEGVQHAHQKGIIHRDIKPSNVLVSIQGEKAVPKIIDFGVAKATEARLTEKTLFTELGQLIGTPEYMSPEQADLTAQDIDTRTDVYSLGVLLYQLLAGALPFDSKDLRRAGFDELRRVIREDDPPKPSTRLSTLGGERSTAAARCRKTVPANLQRRLQGDLDWITMKSLEKDRMRRYASPNELAADLQRHLQHEPVLASPPSTVYRLRKFAVRNRVLVGGMLATSLMLVAGIVVSTAFAVNAERARRLAELEARRAEASQLVTLGGVELESHRTKALAFALASLERTDSPAGRRLALQALWRGPSALVLPLNTGVWGLDFSPDGRWLAGGEWGARVFLWSADGHMVAELPFFSEDHIVKTVRFAPDSSQLFSTGQQPTAKLLSVPDGQLIRSMDFVVPSPSAWQSWLPPLLDAEAKRMVSVSLVPPANSSALFQTWAIDQDQPVLLDRREIEGVTQFYSTATAAVDPTGNRIAYGKGSEIFLVDLAKSGRQRERLVGRHDAPVGRLAFHPDGETLATIDEQGEIRLWSLAPDGGKPFRSLQSVKLCFDFRFDRYGGHLAAVGAGLVHVWDLAAPPDADPIILRMGVASTDEQYSVGRPAFNAAVFHPAGGWIATSGGGHAALWPLGRSVPRVLRGHTAAANGVVFGPKGDWVASVALDGSLRVWPLSSALPERHRITDIGDPLFQVRVSPGGENLLTSSNQEDFMVVPVAGGRQRSLTGFDTMPKTAAAFGPRGRLVAAGGTWGDIRVWDLDTDEVRELDSGDEEQVTEIAFTPDGALVSASSSGDLRLWDLASGTFRMLRESAVSYFALSRDGRRLLGEHQARASVYDLEGGSARELVTHGNQVIAVALDPNGMTAVTASADGVIRVGPVTGEEPHLLLGHEGPVNDVAVSPDGRWIASAGADHTVRLWPMPGGVPLQTLPYEELLGRLRALTNLRIVKDEQSGVGYSLDVNAFPGWESLPVW